MKKSSLIEPASKEDIEYFCVHCVQAYAAYRNQKILHANQETLEKTARTFFGDINGILIDHMILQVCKMTDPDQDFQGNKNLTILFFINGASDDTRSQLEPIGKTITKFTNELKPARNKILAHIDRETVLKGENLGAASDAEWDKFWSDLEEFLKILRDDFFVLRNVGNLTDVESLIRDLKIAHT
jgi:hypothetical protein